MECIAAYDFGTSGVKLAFVGARGEVLAVQEKAYPLYRPQPQYAEQSPDEFWDAVCSVTRKAIQDSGLDPSLVKGVSFSVQAVTIIPVDRDGRVLHNAISWLDGRAEKQAEEINQKCGSELVRAQDYQARLLWIKQNMPELYHKTAFFLDCDGFLQYKATGVMAVSPDYEGVLAYHPTYQKYLEATLSDIDPQKLPPMVAACARYGELSAQGAADLGLVEGTPVFGGMIDVAAAAAGCGCVKPGDAHIYLGSSAWLSVITDRMYEASPGAYQINSILPDLWIYGGCTNSCCLMQNWGIEVFYKREHQELGSGIFDFIAEELAAVPDGCDGLCACPWLFGEQFPIADASIRAIFFNIKQEHTRAHFFKAILESICFSLRGQLDAYRADTGLDIPSIRANGGGAQSPAWMQIMADVLDMPVVIPENVRHSGAIGAAAAAAIGLGWYDAADVVRCLKAEKIFYPNPANKSLYDSKYHCFKQLYLVTKNLYKELNGGECR